MTNCHIIIYHLNGKAVYSHMSVCSDHTEIFTQHSSLFARVSIIPITSDITGPTLPSCSTRIKSSRLTVPTPFPQSAPHPYAKYPQFTLYTISLCTSYVSTCSVRWVELLVGCGWDSSNRIKSSLIYLHLFIYLFIHSFICLFIYSLIYLFVSEVIWVAF